MYSNARSKNENLVALVDTCASGFAFVSSQTAQTLKLTLQTLKSSITILEFEGKLSSKVSNFVELPLVSVTIKKP